MAEPSRRGAAKEASEPVVPARPAARRMIGPGIARAIGISAAFLIALLFQFSGMLGLTGSTMTDVNPVPPVAFALGAVLLGISVEPAASRKVWGLLTSLFALLVSVYLGLGVIVVGATVAIFESDPSSSISAGIGLSLATGFALSRVESVLAWRAAWGWRMLRTGFLALGALSVAGGAGLTLASELRHPLLRAIAQTPLEGLLPGVQVIAAVAVAGGILVGTWKLNRWLARQQLAGFHTDLGVSEALWFLGSMWLLYPWVAVFLPLLRDRAPHNLHFYQAASLAGLFGGLAFLWLFLMVDRPRTSSVTPLVLVLPEPHVSSQLEALASRIARGWRAGPVTLVAHPGGARDVSGTHLRSALGFGTSRVLFPRSAGDIADYLAALPPDFAWTALPRRECYPSAEAWEEAFRRLPTIARVAVLSHGPLGDAAKDIAARLFHHHPRALRADAADRSSITELEAALANSQIKGTGQALRQVAVTYEEIDDAPLADALVAQLDGRKDASGALIEAWAQVLPEQITPGWIFGLRGDFALAMWRRSLKLSASSDATPTTRFVARVARALWPANVLEESKGLFLVLERATAEADGDGTSREVRLERQRIVKMRRNLTSTFPSLLAVRVGKPFGADDASVYGATAHAGWMGHGTNVIHDARDVAEHVLSGRVEPLVPAPASTRDARPTEEATPAWRRQVAVLIPLVASAAAGVYFYPRDDSNLGALPTPTASHQTSPPPSGSPSTSASTPPPIPSSNGGAPPVSGTAGAPPVSGTAGAPPVSETGTLTLDWTSEVETVVSGTAAPDYLNVVSSKVTYSVRSGAPVSLPAGDFTITSPRTEVLPKPSSGFLQPGQSRRLSLKFVSRHGRIDVKGAPLDVMRVDGKEGVPSNGGLRVAPGWHTLTVSDSRGGWSQRVLVKSGIATEVSVPAAVERYYCIARPFDDVCAKSLTDRGWAWRPQGCTEVASPPIGPFGTRLVNGTLLWNVPVSGELPTDTEKKAAEKEKKRVEGATGAVACECTAVPGYPNGCPAGE